MVKERGTFGLGALGFGKFPGDGHHPFGKYRKAEGGVRVDPFRENLKDLFDLPEISNGFVESLPELMQRNFFTARVRELLRFGHNFHELGSVRDAVQKYDPKMNTETISIKTPDGEFMGELFGIVDRRVIGNNRVVFDCVVTTDYGFALATMMKRKSDDELRFVLRKEFTPSIPPERTVEETIVPFCKK